jgi:hypothetical protein
LRQHLIEEIQEMGSERSLEERMENPTRNLERPEKSSVSDPRKVFVVHGRNDAARKAVFDLLLALKLWPLEWNEVASETGTGAPYIFEILQKGFEIAQAIVVVLTPDELVEMRPELQRGGMETGRVGTNLVPTCFSRPEWRLCVIESARSCWNLGLWYKQAT